MTLTKALIYAAASDAAEHSIRSRQLDKWDGEAVDAYHACFQRLFDSIGGAEGWMDLPNE